MHRDPRNRLLPLLDSALSNNATEREINSLVQIAFKFAMTRLKQLIASGKLHMHSVSLPLESIALDCIAELFRRNSDLEFVELAEFFADDRSLDKLSEDDAMVHFYSLVFTKLNDGILRIFRENDPVLSKVIRNIKEAAASMRNLNVIERLGQTYLACSGDHDSSEHLPSYPIEELERALSGMLQHGYSARRFLIALTEHLIDQDRYRRSCSLIDASFVFRRILAEKKIPLRDSYEADTSLLEQDLQRIVSDCHGKISNEFYSTYVQKGKMDGTTFAAYNKALGEFLYDAFVLGNGAEQSQPEYLKRYIQGLTTEEYRISHRHHFEYMARIARKRVRDYLERVF